MDPKFHTYRDFKNFNIEAFDYELVRSNLEQIFHIYNVDEKVTLFNNILLQLFNKHIPLKTVKITKKNTPWVNSEVKQVMIDRDKARLKLRRGHSESNLKDYKRLKNLVNHKLSQEKKLYFENLAHNKNSKQLWRDLKSITNINKNGSNVEAISFDPDVINNYFIDSIPHNSDDKSTTSYYEKNKICGSEFCFSLVSEQVVFEVLQTIKNKSPGSDGIGISLIKLCCPYILPFLVNIINSIFISSHFPDIWKQSQIIPVPKIANPKNLSDLRPISILCGLSKLTEKIISRQLIRHLTVHKILPSTQSGFRSGYSCTTALLHITDDIIQALDDDNCTILVMLDFSKAFDTINHNILLSILKSCGLCSEPLELMRSYITNRTQTVKIGLKTSSANLVKSGVPQGSVLGPLLFTIYTSQFAKFVKHSSIHMYADDTQIYKSFSPNNSVTAKIEINSDLNTLAKIAEQHSLILNPKKTTAMIFAKKSIRAHLKSDISVYVCGEKIQYLDECKSLGLIVDESLRFRTHTSKNIQRAYAALRLLYPHKLHLSNATKKCYVILLFYLNLRIVLQYMYHVLIVIALNEYRGYRMPVLGSYMVSKNSNMYHIN
nr:unnamed protein product [Callosobruchus chinensis]